MTKTETRGEAGPAAPPPSVCPPASLPTSRRWALGAAVLALLLPRRAPAAAPVRIFCDVFNNPPLINGNGTALDPARPGLMIELLRMAAHRATIAIDLARTPWQRGLYLLEAGQADAISASSYVEERLRYGVYPMKDGHPDTGRKLFDLSYRLYIRAGSGVGWDGNTLMHLHAPVGATPGYAVVPVLKAMGVEVAEEPDHLANLHKLLAGRIDAYAELDSHVRPLLRSDPEFAGIIELARPVVTKPYYLMFSKIFYASTPATAERIWDAIPLVNQSDAYQNLMHGKYAE